MVMRKPRRRVPWLVVLSAICSFSSSARAQGPAFLTRDINSGSDPLRSSYPSHLVAVGDVLFFFTAVDRVWHLVVFDGVATRAVSPQPFAAPNNVTAAGSRIFFFDSTSESSTLWTSDGSTATALGSFPSNPCMPLGRAVGAAAGLFYFAAADAAHGEELWRSDGTVEGTRPIDLEPGEAPSAPRSFVASGDEIFFVTQAPSSAPALWRSDGTVEGTARIRTFASPETAPADLELFHSRLFFKASDPEHGYELWSSDGTEEGTRVFADLRLGPDSSGPRGLTATATGLFFAAYDEEHGNELWRTDGTPEGTAIVRDVIPGDDGAFDYSVVCQCGVECLLDAFEPLGSSVFFRVDGELWTSGGTLETTLPLHDFGAFASVRITTAAGGAYVAVTLPGNDSRLWFSDGRVDGTRELGRLLASDFAELDGVYFNGNDGRAGAELWHSDGTVEGTQRVADLVTGPGSSNPLRLTALGDRVFTVADDGEHGFELWVSDATEAGTHLVKDLWPGRDSSLNRCPYSWCPSEIVAGVTAVYFVAEQPSGRGLWRSDGTDEGTVRVVDLALLGPDGSLLQVEPFGDDLYFLTSQPVPSPFAPTVSLWRWREGETDPTVVHEWLASSKVRLFRFDDALHFFGPGGVWRTDGTPEGTALAFATPFAIGEFLSAGPALVFASSDDVWLSGGSEESTRLLKTVGLPTRFVSLVDQFFFVAGSFRRGLWASDFTADGTRAVVGDAFSQFDPRDLTPAQKGIFFTADDRMIVAGHGRELWYSDGTPGGSHLVRDILRGDGSSISDVRDASGGSLDVRRVAAVGESALFAASDSVGGTELWRAESRWASRLQDIAPGPAASAPYGFTVAGRHVFFSADDGRFGRELWALPTSVLETPCAGDCDRDGVVTVAELIAAVRDSRSTSATLLCSAADRDVDAHVDADEVKTGVRRALGGC